MAHTVSGVARLAGITVRTLHHYDRIGLLHPSGRSDAGYRLYDDADCARLQQILFYRELGFGLEEIRNVMDAPDFDRATALRRQRELLAARVEYLTKMIAAVDDAIAARQQGVTMSTEEMLEVFGGFDPSAYEEEVEGRWSGPALEVSRRRTARYGKQQWQEIQAAADSVAAQLAARLSAGADPSDPEVVDLAEKHRLHIDRWYYPCSHETHAGLGAMYVEDPRFAAYWNRIEPGLAEFVRAAITANAARARAAGGGG